MSDGHAFASIFPTIIAQNVNIAGARFLATDDVNGPACCHSNASPDTWRYIMGCSKPLSHYTPLFCIFAPWSNVLGVCVCVYMCLCTCIVKNTFTMVMCYKKQQHKLTGWRCIII